MPQRWPFLLAVIMLFAVVVLKDAGFGATALCEDATYSWGAQPNGACIGHDGVAVWYR